MMPINSVLALRIAWKSDFVVYVLVLVQADPAVYAGLLPSFIVLGGKVCYRLNHTPQQKHCSRTSLFCCAAKCARERKYM